MMSLEDALAVAMKYGREMPLGPAQPCALLPAGVEDKMREALLVLAEELLKPGDECPT
jgi:hypothetical protein